jgi:hypothetical protein
MVRKTSPPTVTKTDPVHGTTEEHPAFAMFSVHRGSYGGKGAHLFQSDVTHRETITVRIEHADRTRAGSHDYVHGHGLVAEVEMSLAQWASAVSSLNTAGVPATLRYEHTGPLAEVDGLDDTSRLAQTMAETKEAAARQFRNIVGALDDLDGLVESKAGVKQIREAIESLQWKIRNAAPNVEYASKTLAEHAEAVVEKTRADIEAIVVQTALHQGLDPQALRLNMGNTDNLPALGTGEVKP